VKRIYYKFHTYIACLRNVYVDGLHDFLSLWRYWKHHISKASLQYESVEACQDDFSPRNIYCNFYICNAYLQRTNVFVEASHLRALFLDDMNLWLELFFFRKIFAASIHLWLWHLYCGMLTISRQRPRNREV
jgi:hypothetical protein